MYGIGSENDTRARISILIYWRRLNESNYCCIQIGRNLGWEFDLKSECESGRGRHRLRPCKCVGYPQDSADEFEISNMNFVEEAELGSEPQSIHLDEIKPKLNWLETWRSSEELEDRPSTTYNIYKYQYL